MATQEPDPKMASDEDPINNPLPPHMQPGPLTPEHQTPQPTYEDEPQVEDRTAKKGTRSAAK